MPKGFLITIDQGTTGSRVFFFNHKGEVLSSAYRELTQYFPQPGWVEHDVDEIWNSIESLLEEGLQKANLDPQEAVAIGITNQRETSVLWEKKTGAPIHRAIVWQCRRTAGFCQKLKDENHEKTIRSKTGLTIDPYFSGTKVRWFLENIEGARRKAKNAELLFGTIDTFLLYRLTDGDAHSTDYTNASRTMFYNIHEKCWDQELCELFDVPMSVLPEVGLTASTFGRTRNMKSLPDGIPICSMVGDQQSALFGQLCFLPGHVKNTYGTGCFMLMNTGEKCLDSKNGLISTIACNKRGQPSYALEGGVFIGGAVMQFLRDSLHFFKDASESEAMAESVESDDEIVFVPAFAGLGAPHWNQDARGAIFGLSRDTSIQQITRAALKSIALQSKELLDAMQKDAGMKISALKADGGATKNRYLMNYQAALMGVPIVLPQNIETTVLGAAYLAGLASGFWSSTSELKRLNPVREKFLPEMLSQNQVEKELQRWKTSIKRIQVV